MCVGGLSLIIISDQVNESTIAMENWLPDIGFKT